MAHAQRLELKHAQSLMMTLRQQQSLKLLTMSNIELVEYVDQSLQDNPLLERDETGVDDFGGSGGDDVTPKADGAPHIEMLPNRESTGALLSRGNEVALDQRLCERVTLRQHLLWQLQVEIGDPCDRLIGTHLIDMLDEAGYLREDLTALSGQLAFGLPRVEAALMRLQQFEPPGIFARSLAECLALQLADRNRLDPAMLALLENLDLLANGDRDKLKSLCGVDDEDLTDMESEILALDAKPAHAFDIQLAETLVPDILLRARPDGGWRLELNSEALPRVLVNNSYYAWIRKQTRKQSDLDYLTERFQSANWLQKTLHERAITILRVATEIVRQQDAFLHRGVQHMRPLRLRDVAEAVDRHESTVSRAVSNKYIATPRGICELRYFFSISIRSAGSGSAYSDKAVRDRIRELINAEDPAQVLSDDMLANQLRDDGIEIARRTVAKYRSAMGIPSSSHRRRAKSSPFH